jgi:hypothetical protein
MGILLVEDDLKVVSLVSMGLKGAGFVMDHAADGEDSLHLALTESYSTTLAREKIGVARTAFKHLINGSGHVFETLTFPERESQVRLNSRLPEEL